MTSLIAAFATEDVVIVALPIVSVLVVLMTAILTHHHRSLQRDDMEGTLKMEMIQRGMSAEEIERVLAARIGSQSNSRRHNASGLAPAPGKVQPEV